MTRRRITEGSLSFQPQAGSVSREIDIVTKRAADNITSISRRMRAQKESERNFVQKTLDNIDNLKEESSLIHRTAFNSEVDNLKQNVFDAFAKKNKRGKVRGFDIYDPEIRNFVQSEVSRLNKLISRSQPLVDEAEKAIKDINADDTITNKAEAVANVTDYMNDVNSLISNKAPLVSYNEIITAAQNPNLVIRNMLDEKNKSVEMFTNTKSDETLVDGGKNILTETKTFVFNPFAISEKEGGVLNFNDDYINNEVQEVIRTNNPALRNLSLEEIKQSVQNYYTPETTIKRDTNINKQYGTGEGGTGNVITFSSDNVYTENVPMINEEGQSVETKANKIDFPSSVSLFNLERVVKDGKIVGTNEEPIIYVGLEQTKNGNFAVGYKIPPEDDKILQLITVLRTDATEEEKKEVLEQIKNSGKGEFVRNELDENLIARIKTAAGKPKGTIGAYIDKAVDYFPNTDFDDDDEGILD